MSPSQCRQARERLNWSRQDLAAATGVPVWFIVAFEDEKQPAEFLVHYELALRAAFEDVGIGFPFAIGGAQVASAGITYSPRERRETN